jgi:type IV pilus assembly protein PilO
MNLPSGIHRIWRQRTWVWAPALAFFVLNLALFSAYRMVYSGQVENLRDRLASRMEQLEELEAEAAEAERLVESARTTREALAGLYENRLASERTRFTKVTAEVRELARRSGLEPSAMSYPTEEIEDYGLVKRYFTFSVSGTYVELRRFINLLELTPTFITLEQVSLSGDDNQGNQLRIRLTLSTLFAEEGAEPARAEAAGGDGERTARATRIETAGGAT